PPAQSPERRRHLWPSSACWLLSAWMDASALWTLGTPSGEKARGYKDKHRDRCAWRGERTAAKEERDALPVLLAGERLGVCRSVSDVRRGAREEARHDDWAADYARRDRSSPIARTLAG